MKKKVLHISCGGLGYGGVSSVIFSIVEKLYSRFDFECIVFKKRDPPVLIRTDIFLLFYSTSSGSILLIWLSLLLLISYF